MKQNLFSSEELAKIEESAMRNQVLREENCLDIGIVPQDVINLSHFHGLILTKGNEDTGFDHILERHELYSRRAYWKEEDGKVKLAYPSKFSPKSIPIIDYVLLADALYDPKFLNTANNKEPELFDLYEGSPPIELAEGRRYRMLLYRNTKVIHTLYPTNEKYTKKKPKGFVFQRGAVETSEDVLTCDVTVRMAYLDHHKVKRYTVVIVYRPLQKLRTLEIKIHRENKRDLSCQYPSVVFDAPLPGSGFLHVQHQYIDLPDIESEILAIELDREKWEAFP